MLKKIREKFKKVNSQKGFTLLEILVVLTIMGFLIAMVAPRLAGISGDAVDTVCDSNQNRMVTYLSSFFEKTNRFPNNLTNLVKVDGTSATAYSTPVVSNQDPDDGAEVLAAELNDRNHFKIHNLNGDEADELKNMGIVKLLNLNDYSGLTTDPTDPHPFMDPVTPAENVGVAMVGFGYAGGDADWTIETEERGWGEPCNFARIVLGMGPECGLITSGVISNAAHCPGGIQNADNVTYNDYIVLLPRLEATAARMTTGTALTTVDVNSDLTDGVKVKAVAYDDEPGAAYDVDINNENLRARTFTVSEAQEGWQFATMCPEGHMYPADDEEFWGVSLDGNNQIN